MLKDLLVKLGEAKQLDIFSILKSGAIGSDIDVASAVELLGAPYQVAGIVGSPDLSGDYATALLSSPDGGKSPALPQPRPASCRPGATHA